MERLLQIPPPAPKWNIWTPLTRAARVTLFSLLVIALAVWAWIPGTRPQDVLLHNWRAQWEMLSETDVELRCQQIARLGHEGLDELAETTCHWKSSVARIASLSIDKWSRDWNEFERVNYAPRLSEFFKQNINRTNPAAIPSLWRVVQRLVSWPLATTNKSSSDYLLNCEFLLTSFRDRSSLDELIFEETPTDAPGDLPPDTVITSEQGDSDRLVRDTTRESITDPDVIVDVAGGAATIAPSIVEVPVSERTRDSDLALDVDINGVKRKRTSPTDFSEEHTSPVVRIRSQKLDILTDRELVERLRDATQTVVTAVHQEMKNRGFTELHLFVATQYSDSDPHIRRKLVRALPRMKLDSRPWLVWLATDPDPSVRSEAIGLIATSADSTLQQQLEAILATEVEPEIRQQVKRPGSRGPYVQK